MVVAFLLIGPAPFFALDTSTTLIEGSIAIAGVGYAIVMVSTFSRAQSEALKKGFPDDIETYLMISGTLKAKGICEIILPSKTKYRWIKLPVRICIRYSETIEWLL